MGPEHARNDHGREHRTCNISPGQPHKFARLPWRPPEPCSRREAATRAATPMNETGRPTTSANTSALIMADAGQPRTVSAQTRPVFNPLPSSGTSRRSPCPGSPRSRRKSATSAPAAPPSPGRAGLSAAYPRAARAGRPVHTTKREPPPRRCYQPDTASPAHPLVPAPALIQQVLIQPDGSPRLQHVFRRDPGLSGRSPAIRCTRRCGVSVLSVLACRFFPRSAAVSAGSARCGLTPAATSSSTTRRQPVQPPARAPPHRDRRSGPATAADAPGQPGSPGRAAARRSAAARRCGPAR